MDLETLSKNDGHSKHRLENSLDQLLKDMLSHHHMFNYYGFELMQPVADKIKLGIFPVIIDLHKRVSALHTILKTIQPSMVFSNGCRTDTRNQRCYKRIPAGDNNNNR